MCGICGVYENNRSKFVDPYILKRMLRIIEHRGPDAEGAYFDKGFAMGMRRLSIIDLSSGNQPIWNEDKSLVIVFNGEIYNYAELRDFLVARGHTFATNSDTEVIIHLYEELGESCVRWLRGMFAFAVWDIRNRRLFLARDHLGVKPLYYTQTGKRLIFGSEIKAILQHPDVQPQMDLEALNNYLTLRYVPAPQTMFSGIYVLPPAHSLTIDAHGMQIKRYWDISFAPAQENQLSEDEYTEQLESLLRESVRLQLMSDVPFGAFLSGGVDSSLVVALMSQFMNEPVKTFSVGYDGGGSSFSELPYARLVAQKYATDHHEVFIKAEDFIDGMQMAAWHLDQPIADYAEVAYLAVAKLAGQHVKMVLTGEGGDELFAGYGRYVGEQFSPLFNDHLPNSVKSLALDLSDRIPKLRRPKSALYALCQSDEATRFANWIPLFNDQRKNSLLSDDMKHKLNRHATKEVFRQQLQNTDATDPLNRMLYVDTKLWLPDYLLSRGDKLTMAASLEARVPLLDYKLVEFAASLPPHLKLNQLKRKYLLKKVARRLLPSEIIDRKKQGFPVPIPLWFRNEAHTFLRDTLAPATIKSRGLFDPAYVEKLLVEHETGFADHATMLYGLVNVELWQRMFIDSQVNAVASVG
jgi:asparagine synthase (glutamine-hydrolysing)